MRNWNTTTAVVTGTVLSLAVLWGTLAASDRDSINTAVLQDYDSGKAAILSLSDGVLRLPPSSDLDKSTVKHQVRQLGDITYDYVEGPNLFVSSGRVVAIDSKQLSASGLTAAVKSLASRETLSGTQLDVGKTWLVQTRQGKYALLKVVRIDQRKLEIDWLYADNSQGRFSEDNLKQLMSRSLESKFGTVVLSGVDNEDIVAFRFDKLMKMSLRWPATAADDPTSLRNKLNGADIAPFSYPSGTTLLLGAERYAFLGRGSLADYADIAAGKSRSLSREPYIRSQFIQPGAIFLLKTVTDRFALVRIDQVNNQKITLSYVYQPDGTAHFKIDKQESSMASNSNLADKNIALLQAAITGSATRARESIAAGADVNAVNRRGFSALQVAITREDQATIDTLLESGADPEMKSKYGWNALHIASQFGNAKVVTEFLERGMNANELTPDGETALQIAISSNRETNVVRSILKSHSKNRASLFDAAMADDAAAIKKMVSVEDINAVDSRGRTALILAAEYSSASALRELLHQGADTTIIAPFRQGDALSVAARAGQTGIIHALALEVTADQKTEALYHAIVSQKAEAMVALIDVGADLNAHVHGKASLRDQAFSFGRAPIVSALRDRGEVLPLWAAARLGDIEAIGAALARSPVIDTSPVDSQSALVLAVLANSSESVLRLLKYGSDLSAKGADGETVLHLAARNGQTAMVDLLLDRGAAIDEGASNGRTALAHAAVNGHIATMKLLLNRGANVAITPRGLNSLAEITGNEDAQKLLLRWGAP